MQHRLKYQIDDRQRPNWNGTFSDWFFSLYPSPSFEHVFFRIWWQWLGSISCHGLMIIWCILKSHWESHSNIQHFFLRLIEMMMMIDTYISLIELLTLILESLRHARTPAALPWHRRILFIILKFEMNIHLFIIACILILEIEAAYFSFSFVVAGKEVLIYLRQWFLYFFSSVSWKLTFVVANCGFSQEIR